MNWLVIDEILINALKEDNLYGDMTSGFIVNKNNRCKAAIISNEDGIIAGTTIFKRIFFFLGDVKVRFSVIDGDKIKKGQVIGRIEGNTRSFLNGEGLAMNLIQRMSGIATITRTYAERIEETNAKILNTRKTTPNLRMLEKYAVKVGGGYNPRFNLSDGVLIKHNHIDVVGGIKNAVDMARRNISFVRRIEVEVESIEQVYDALKAGADTIILYNMDIKTIKQAVNIIDYRSIVEVLGNVNLKNIREIAESGVDYISLGIKNDEYKYLDMDLKSLT